MNPIGLTRAEEAAEQPAPPVAIVLPAPGEIGCRVVAAQQSEACGAKAEWIIIWPDDDETAACGDCVVRMRALAANNRTTIRVEPLRPSRMPKPMQGG